MRLRGCLNRRSLAPGKIGRIFVGADGVRSGWRAALYLTLEVIQSVALILAILAILKHAGRPINGVPKIVSPLLITVSQLTSLVPVLTASALMAWLEDTRFLSYGLGGVRKVARLLTGFAGGFMALSLLMLILIVTGYGVASHGGLRLAGNLRYGTEWLAVCLLIGFTEEFAFRGYLLRALERGTGFWPAALITSGIFVAAHGHNPGETYVGMVQVFASGVLSCVGIWWTKSLWWSIGFHAAWDYAQNFIFGTHDSGLVMRGTLMNFLPRGNIFLSGGPTGPEGSIFSLAVTALAAAIAWYAFARRMGAQLQN